MPLTAESELRVGNKTFTLKCLRAHGGGIAADDSRLEAIKLYFPTDDPDGQCVGPLNREHPSPGQERYRWTSYLTITWNAKDRVVSSAQFTEDGVTYDLRKARE